MMLLIIAALWVWVFVPSWFKRSEERQGERKFAGEIKAEIKAAKSGASARAGSVSAMAERSFRLSVTRKVFGSFLFSSFLAGVYFSVAAFAEPIFWGIVGGCLAISLGSVLILRKASAQARSLLAKSSQSRSALFAETASIRIEAETLDERAWVPNPLPAQRARMGTLEVPALAEVVAIEPAKTLSSNELDEILRRRRANG